ncbi:16S rRNA (cytosine(1402)-N(4))-methyltransferase RsmH [Candidatus Fokinia crypta]|uniref:Ribosomal RNA small subunit methyltransferase H n=1 Tax=Candidatus Fokinia crypta TaxID=1920990 RepID=A0ABZ0USX5_9RICK|nr:16S rRNA (cytosine(1402)-N(4))-methyltransferase RsmH [Candidatus Fokinia cryptica]WPX98129.1 Ribosomal RNA small subunit methyltransferase H [Candidatus Fokinia cryptica]
MHCYTPHIPVLIKEVLNYMIHTNTSISNIEDCVFCDATFGAGGHTSALIKELSSYKKKGLFLCSDRDEHSIEFFERLHKDTSHSHKMKFFNVKFNNLNEILNTTNLYINGMMVDLGFSSMQIDSPDRGFSIQNDGPLLMTMGLNDKNASDILNSLSTNELEKILRIYGEEPRAKEIAHSIFRYKQRKKLSTTYELKSIVHEVYNYKGKYSKIDPATLTFQALRIHINQELYQLMHIILTAASHIAINGRFIVITFHGLEDIVVKAIFRSIVREQHLPLENKIISNLNKNIFLLDAISNQKELENEIIRSTKQYNNSINHKSFYMLNSGNVIKATHKEIKTNRRARSAKIRILERIS